MLNSGSFQEGPGRAARRSVYTCEPLPYVLRTAFFVRKQNPQLKQSLCSPKVSAVPERSGSISPLGSMDWSSDVASDENVMRNERQVRRACESTERTMTKHSSHTVLTVPCVQLYRNYIVVRRHVVPRSVGIHLEFPTFRC
jgi:hypothetical protein